MSFTYLPIASKVNITPSGTLYNVDVETPSESVPFAVDKFLKDAGWQQFNMHPDTHEPLFEKEIEGVSPDLKETVHCRWHEAVAYEFYRFLTIGDK